MHIYIYISSQSNKSFCISTVSNDSVNIQQWLICAIGVCLYSEGTFSHARSCILPSKKLAVNRARVLWLFDAPVYWSQMFAFEIVDGY